MLKMKGVLIILVAIFTLQQTQGQLVHKIKADSVLITNDSGIRQWVVEGILNSCL
jgi:hypothetical protein